MRPAIKFKPGTRKATSGRDTRKFWSPEDEARLLFLHDDDFTEAEIAADMGRTVDAVRQRLLMLQYRRRVAEGTSKISPHVQQVREARAAGYDARDITGTIFGDPPRGFSALDKRSDSVS